MFSEKSKAADTVSSVLTASAGAVEGLSAKGRYTLVCTDADGNVKWATKKTTLWSTLASRT